MGTFLEKMAIKASNVYFLYGGDAYALQERAKELIRFYEQKNYVLEIFQPLGTTVADAESCLREVQVAMRYGDLFAPLRILWVRSVDFLSDTPTGRSEAVKQAVEDFAVQCENFLKDNICILSACPVDRRTKIFKRLAAIGQSEFFPEAKSSTELFSWFQKLCQEKTLDYEEGVWELLCQRIGFSKQALAQELEKISLFKRPQGVVRREDVFLLVPELAVGEFFEAVDLFYGTELQLALQGLQRYFFSYKEVRPLLSALQNRNRLMLMLRYFMDSGELNSEGTLFKVSWESIVQHYSSLFSAEKTSFNIFQQNFWYLSRIFQDVKRFSLETLLKFQEYFFEGLQQTVYVYEHTEMIMSELFRRCFNLTIAA